jgi:hypothetical protein
MPLILYIASNLFANSTCRTFIWKACIS